METHPHKLFFFLLRKSPFFKEDFLSGLFGALMEIAVGVALGASYKKFIITNREIADAKR